jgi:hypothetical protein
MDCRTLLALLGSALACVSLMAHAEPAPFDLAGPTLELTVTRNGVTLPAARVPSLAGGDQLHLKADLPPEQSAHYLMVVAFLRGATNPPPAEWFQRCETWTGKCAQEGLSLTVPKEAQQLLVFLAPATGGDFKTLVNAVRGRPGAFVRTSQELNQATLDRSRLEGYLGAIRTLAENDPARLKEAAPLLARSLAIKVDEKCLEKMASLQAPCLMQGREALILSDGHSTSLAQTLTSGPASDLAMAAASTAQLKSGYYGPYIGSLFDIARLFDSFHTAQYQYIPALATTHEAKLALVLNAAPSFHDPKSVLVMALPAIDSPQLPPLHAVDPKEVLCARRNPLLVPVDGAPLVFSTGFAHAMTLSLVGRDGNVIALPARADAERGGFLVDTSALGGRLPGDALRGTLQGRWGFDAYQGPAFTLTAPHGQSWQLGPAEESGVVVGREDTVHLHAPNTQCVVSVSLRQAAAAERHLEWKSVASGDLEVKVPLQDVPPGELTLLVQELGGERPSQIALHGYAEASHLDTFTLHAGDSQGVLTGNRLDQVEHLDLKELEFVPESLSRNDGRDELSLSVRSGQHVALSQGELSRGRVALKDGRELDVRVAIESPRPSARIIDKSALLTGVTGGVDIRLAGPEELPQNAQVTFSLRAQSPTTFSRGERIEVATEEGTSAVLDARSGAVTFENAHVAVATFEPSKSLGPGASGPLRYRILNDTASGDWRPLATLVRLPQLRTLECPESPDEPCTLTGMNLFLLDSVAGDAGFTRAVQVPDGFPGRSLQVPHPEASQIYVKLRDDPQVVSVASVDAHPGRALTRPPGGS